MDLYFYEVYPPVCIVGVTAGSNPCIAEFSNYWGTDGITFCAYWVRHINVGALPISRRPEKMWPI
jgi:hypothetical protein